MVKIKITVLKTAIFNELQPYCNNKIEKCPCFNEGQIFETTYEKPEGFCDWAWKDIHPYIASFLTGGNFSNGIFEGWMKDKNTMIACCTDGIRPVIFEIKKVKEN
ncbi:MAG: TIGR04076 family protein [Ignavibacteria bacterium]